MVARLSYSSQHITLRNVRYVQMSDPVLAPRIRGEAREPVKSAPPIFEELMR